MKERIKHVIPDLNLRPIMGVTEEFLKKGIKSIHEALEYVGRLPYGRNTDRADYRLVLSEEVGTCSTKHALLAKLLQEQQVEGVQLTIGLYEMNERNTPGVGVTLEKYGLPGIPEAHCYLVYQGVRCDYTRLGVESEPITEWLLEVPIEPSGIGEEKIKLHQNFLSTWNPRWSGEELWNIREACIRALSQG